MGRCIAISEARRRPRPLRALPRAQTNRYAGALPKSAAALPRKDTSVSNLRYYLLRFWTWLAASRPIRSGRRL